MSTDNETGSKEIAIRKEVNTENLISQAINKNVPVETMEKLLVMAEKVKAEIAKEAFFKAYAKFQSDCPTIEKKKPATNRDGSPRYYYAPIEDIVEQVKKPLADNGLSYDFDTITSEDKKYITIICYAYHVDGYTKEKRLTLPIDKPIGDKKLMTDIQYNASTLTYGKRYCFCNTFGIMTAEEDNDANIDLKNKIDEGKAGKPIKSDKKARKDIISAITKKLMKEAENKQRTADLKQFFQEQTEQALGHSHQYEKLEQLTDKDLEILNKYLGN